MPGVGKPVVVTAKEFATPTTKATPLALVIDGAVPAPVHESAIFCVEGAPFSALSVSVRRPLRVPVAVGTQTAPTLQDAPAASGEEAEQVVVPASILKLALAEKLEKVRPALPMFCTVMACGALALPKTVEGKAKDGACERGTSTTRLL